MNYSYDANSRQTFAEKTDHTNQQTSVYDALGQRVQTIAAGANRHMVYDIFGQILAEYKGGLIERENIYRGGQLLATQEFTTPPPTPENVTWMNVSGTIQVSGNSLTKVSGTSSWYDAGAVSTQTIAAGDGYIEFTPGQTTTWRAAWVMGTLAPTSTTSNMPSTWMAAQTCLSTNPGTIAATSALMLLRTACG